MRMLCGVLTPTSGRAWIDGIDVTSHPERARELVGYLPESAPVYPEMRVDEYLLFRANLYRVSTRAAILRVVEQRIAAGPPRISCPRGTVSEGAAADSSRPHGADTR